LIDWTDSILEGDKPETVRDLVGEAHERVKRTREAIEYESLDGGERAIREAEAEQALRDLGRGGGFLSLAGPQLRTSSRGGVKIWAWAERPLCRSLTLFLIFGLSIAVV